MRVKVKFFASYREAVGKQEIEAELPEGATVTDLWQYMASKYPGLPAARRWVAAAVNRRYVSPSIELAEGDEVVFMPPMSGGSDVFEITAEELTADPVLDEVVDEATGAVVVFVGTVRAFTDDKEVAALEYEAYQEMAEPKMAEIAREIRDKWDIRHIAIRHRTGHMEVGEVSVVIAVSASHRKEAFAACQYAIDRLKETVPIWKKEIGPGGEEWV